jgi:predicted Fe-Mo cluster-binding NifX family protein
MAQRIVVSAASDDGLDAPISGHFGRALYFAIVEVEAGEIHDVTFAANPHHPHHQPGQVPAFVQSLGANVMLSGGMGGRAIALFDRYGIDVATGATGTVGHAVTCYLNGELNSAGACRESVEHGHA